MKPIRFIFTIILVASATVVGSEAKTYVGIVTDSTCAQDHNGKRLYLLSDQDTAARFAGATVRVTGVLETVRHDSSRRVPSTAASRWPACGIRAPLSLTMQIVGVPSAAH